MGHRLGDMGVAVGLDDSVENARARLVEREIAILSAAISVVRLVRDFSCEERSQIEAKVKDIIG